MPQQVIAFGVWLRNGMGTGKWHLCDPKPEINNISLLICSKEDIRKRQDLGALGAYGIGRK